MSAPQKQGSVTANEKSLSEMVQEMRQEFEEKQKRRMEKLESAMQAFDVECDKLRKARDEENELLDKVIAKQAELSRAIARVDTKAALVLSKMVANARARGDPFDSGMQSGTPTRQSGTPTRQSGTPTPPPSLRRGNRPVSSFRPQRSHENRGGASSGKPGGGRKDLQ